jgi:hypothetical protein
MAERKFGRLTADMLVRKGDAAPSDIRRPRRRKYEQPALSIVSASRPRVEEPPLETADQTIVPGEDSDLLLPYGVFEPIAPAVPKEQHRLVIVLSEEEYQTLGILAVKTGFSRHQVLRKALDGYLEWLVDEYGADCRCISSTCSADCDHLRPAEASERPTDAD